MNRIGIQYLAHSVDDRQKAEARFRECPSQSVVIVDDPTWAINFKKQHPSTLVIHRTTLPNENDKHFHDLMKPRDFIEMNRVFADTNVVVQVYNEPETYRDFGKVIDFCAALHDENLALRGNRVYGPLRFCFLNVGMGHVAEFAPPLMDPLLRRLSGYSQGSVLGVHEYAERSTKLERPHHIGRFELIANRCRQLGIRPVQFAVTEFGRDSGGGYNDGYQSHMSPEEYVQFIWEAMDAYSPFNIPINVFCYGHGYRRWDKFNIEHDQVVIEGIQRYGKVAPAKPLFRGLPTAPALAAGRLLKPAGAMLNVRLFPQLPSAPVLGTIRTGEIVQFRSYGREWYYVHSDGGLRGYVSTQAGKVQIG
jgi:hypothetical protein